MQKQLSTPVVGSDSYTNLTGNSAANNGNESSLDNSLGNIKPNYPRLPVKLEGAKLKLLFLKRCQQLKRPPSSLRLKHNTCIKLKSFIKLASVAETDILLTAIKEKREEIDFIRRCIKLSDANLDDCNENETTNLQRGLDKKFHWLKKQDTSKWIDWPSKSTGKSKSIPPAKPKTTGSSTKKSRNVFKRLHQIQNRLLKTAKTALDRGTVVNLTDTQIPPEAIAVLSKRIGFVPAAEHNHLEMRTDCSTTLAKLSGATKHRLNKLRNEDISDSEDFTPCVPRSLKRERSRMPTKSGDKVIDDLTDEIMSNVNLLNPPAQRSNLSKFERKGLKWILKEVNSGDLQVVRADKGGALCIIPKTFMHQLEAKKINDTTLYNNLGEQNPTPAAHKNLLDLWRFGEDEGFVAGNEAYEVVGLCEKKNGKKQRLSTLIDFKPGIPYFYGLLKLHKLAPEELKAGVDIPIRLVTNLRQSVTSRSDKFLSWKYLLPLQNEYCKDSVKDSTEVLRWLENINNNPNISKSRLSSFSWDFSSLYDNLTPSLVLEALRCAMEELRPDWSPEFKEWLIELVTLSLESSFARFGKNWFKSIIGIPTGGSLSVALANIALYYVLKRVIYSSPDTPTHLLALKRFIDDISGLWTGSKADFICWSDHVNQRLQEFGLSIKDNADKPWELNDPATYTTFLDIRYCFSDEEGLQTDINIKETDARAYLHYSSYHPRGTFPSIIYSQCLRYRRIINNGVRLIRRLEELKEYFINSGYPKKMVQGIVEDVLRRARNLEYKEKTDDPPFPVVWVQTFGPATPQIKKIVADANDVAKLSPLWKDEKTVIGIVNKRSKNLGDLILRRKKFALHHDEKETGTTRCTPEPNTRIKKPRGRPCGACGMMSNKRSVTSTVTGETYKTPSGNCKTKRAVYLAECRLCKMQYTGKTSNKLQTRISGHRSHVADFDPEEDDEDSDEKALAEHLLSEHNISDVKTFNESYAFTVLQINPKNLDKCEQMWANRLVTLRPFGLNREKPCGVADSILDMSLRASQSQRR